jgi:hypothetical protein
MKIRTKTEITGGFLLNKLVSFSLDEVTINLFTLNERNYVEASRQVIAYHNLFDKGFEEILEYEYEQESPLLKALKCFESIGSFLFRIQDIKYDERETDWIAETDEEKAIIDRLPKTKWSIEKSNSLTEVSEDKIEQLISLCSTQTDCIYAFEFLRQGNVSFRNYNFYFAFINYFMLMEEAFGKGEYHMAKLEKNFVGSDVLHLCVLTAIDMLCRTPLESLYVEWMQKEVKRRQKDWNFSGIVSCMVRFRGDYLHSHERVRTLEQRDQFFKYMTAFTQAVCWAYCRYIIYSENKTDSEKTEYIADEIKRLNVYWRL